MAGEQVSDRMVRTATTRIEDENAWEKQDSCVVVVSIVGREIRLNGRSPGTREESRWASRTASHSRRGRGIESRFRGSHL